MQTLAVGCGAGFSGDRVDAGLPVVRTSVDHGTALDLAGTRKADPGSLHAALALVERNLRPGRMLASGRFDRRDGRLFVDTRRAGNRRCIDR